MFVFKEADDIHGTTQTTKIYADVFVKYGGPDIYYYMHYNNIIWHIIILYAYGSK